LEFGREVSFGNAISPVKSRLTMRRARSFLMRRKKKGKKKKRKKDLMDRKIHCP